MNNHQKYDGRIRYFPTPGWQDVEVYIGDEVTAPERQQFHEDVEIRFITRGEARIELNGAAYSAAAGWLALLPPRQLHSVSAASPDGLSFFALRIGATLFERLKDSAPTTTGLRITHGAVPAEPALSSTLIAAHRALADGSPAAEAQPILRRAVRDLASWGARVEMEPADRPTRHARAIDGALAHLRANYTHEISLDDLAAAAGLSKFHFLRLFAARLGTTPHRYQLLLRVIHAKRLLRGGVEIAEVALRSGFFDQSHFTRCFHEIVGVTPGRYQVDVAASGAKNGSAAARNFVQDIGARAFGE
jgi:AraC-like DNA-binding protein